MIKDMPEQPKESMKPKVKEQVVDAMRERPRRKKVYQPVEESKIPQEIINLFAKDNYTLKPIRWSIQGIEDYRHLSKREKEGYEFVTVDELPQWYLSSIRLLDTKARRGLVTMGDLCLMKIDTDLRNSRIAHFTNRSDEQVAGVDINVLEKKGFRNVGTKSRTMMREPTFQE